MIEQANLALSEVPALGDIDGSGFGLLHLRQRQREGAHSEGTANAYLQTWRTTE